MSKIVLGMAETIDEAKRVVMKRYGHGTYDRPPSWLEATPPDSYENPAYRVMILVCEGSPPKGYVIVDYRGGGRAIAFDGGWKRLRTVDRFDVCRKLGIE